MASINMTIMKQADEEPEWSSEEEDSEEESEEESEEGTEDDDEETGDDVSRVQYRMNSCLDVS